jgi:hypothetical protein
VTQSEKGRKLGLISGNIILFYTSSWSRSVLLVGTFNSSDCWKCDYSGFKLPDSTLNRHKVIRLYAHGID